MNWSYQGRLAESCGAAPLSKPSSASGRPECPRVPCGSKITENSAAVGSLAGPVGRPFQGARGAQQIPAGKERCADRSAPPAQHMPKKQKRTHSLHGRVEEELAISLRARQPVSPSSRLIPRRRCAARVRRFESRSSTSRSGCREQGRLPRATASCKMVQALGRGQAARKSPA